jgi:hypothetical protein
MSAHTISRIIVRVARWSSTGNAAVRPERRPAPPVTLYASPKHSVSAVLSNPVTRFGVRNHKVLVQRRRLNTRRAYRKWTGGQCRGRFPHSGRLRFLTGSPYIPPV